MVAMVTMASAMIMNTMTIVTKIQHVVSQIF